MAIFRKIKTGNTLEILIILSVLLVTGIASQVYQLHITYNNGQSFDGVFYYRVAYQFSKGMKASSEAPFVYRIGTPFLVAVFFKDNLLYGFKVINIIANVLAVILFVFWLRLFLNDWRIRTLLVVLFITQWHGPVRFTYYDPTYTDPWLFVFLLIGLIAIQKIKSRPGLLAVGILGLISFIGVIFREVVLIIPIALAFSMNPIPLGQEMLFSSSISRAAKFIKRIYYPFLFPFLLGIAGFLVTRLVASQYNDYSFTKTALDWVYDKQLPTYIHAYFITYGPLLILAVYSWRSLFRFLRENQYMLVFLVGFMVLAWIGGSDTERFLYWAMPVVYLLIGIAIQENTALLKSPWLILFLVGTTICAQRLFWIVPDYPNTFITPVPILSILSNKFQYLDLWSWFAARTVQEISLAEYVFLSVILLVWLRLRSNRIRPVNIKDVDRENNAF
jgi:hypothetical protein